MKMKYRALVQLEGQKSCDTDANTYWRGLNDSTKSKSKLLSCSNVIYQYKKHMDGFDLLDSNIDQYKNKMWLKKYYFKIFCHLLDESMINAQILYK